LAMACSASVASRLSRCFVTTQGCRTTARAALSGDQRRWVGVASLQPPNYVKVPISVEEPEAILFEMPELVLSPVPSAPSTIASPNPGSGITLDTPIAIQQPSAGATDVANVSMPETRFAELSNGVRIAAVDRQGMCASIGLFVGTGSRYELPEFKGVSHMLELMAFRSSAHLSHLRTLKTLEQLGAAVSCRVGREDILYQCDVLREYVPVALPLMLSNVLCPSLVSEEVAAAHEHIAEVQLQLEENVEGFLSEQMHSAAFSGSALARPLYAQEQDLPRFTPETIRAYIDQHCGPNRLIVIGVNVDFNEFCKWTSRSFAEFPRPALPVLDRNAVVPTVYVGGDIRLEKPNPLCHLMIGWEIQGGWNGASLATFTVLQMLLGGGGSFSTGGPGKGMHTRLYTDVLNRHHWVESCQANSVMYTDTGLFTVYSTVVPQHAGEFITVLARIFSGLGWLKPEEVQRAKNALKSGIHMNLETRGVMMEDVGRQLIMAGRVGTAQEFGRMIDAVTDKDLVDAVRQFIVQKPTVVSYGDIGKVPSYEQISKTLAKGCP